MLQILRRFAIGLAVVCAVVQIGSRGRLHAYGTGVVISQIYGAGGNVGAVLDSDYIELYNPGPDPVNLAGWSVQYASATGSTWNNRTNLSGTIQPGHYFLIQESKGTNGAPLPVTPDIPLGGINMSGSAGKLALVSSTTALSGTCPTGGAIVDFVGFGSTANCYEGTGPTGTLSTTAAALRAGSGAIDTNSNAADFTVGTPAPRNSSCTLTDGCPATTNPAISAPPISVLQGDPVLLKVSVAPGASPTSTGITVTGNLSAIGGLSTQPFYDDGTNGDLTAGDLVFSFAVPAIATPGTYAIPMSASDAQSRNAAPVTLQLTVAALTPIHDIQGAGLVSPYAGQKVTTRGIVTGVKYNGYFIQTPDADADGDPNTSEGVFVYTSSTPPAAAVLGNGVQVTATVSEFKGASTDPNGLSMTELTGPTTTLLTTGNALPAIVSLGAADLSAGDSRFTLEKYEGMRVHVDTVLSISPAAGSVDEPSASSTPSGVFFGVLPGTGRPFREAGIETPYPVPPEAPAGTVPPVFDSNPERIGVDTFSVFPDPATAAVFPPPPGSTLEVTSGVTVSNVTGPLDYSYGSYIIDAESWNRPTVDGPNAAVQPVRARADHEFTVATMNLERFYDTTDDPAVSDTVLTPAAFDLRLTKASMAILGVLRSPDVLGVEEMENLPTLQALADRVNADAVAAGQSQVHYGAYLFEGNDVGGIDVGFLVRSDRITVDAIEQYGKDSTFVQPDGVTAMLNDRPSLILHAQVLNAPYDPYPVTVVVNHLRSMSDVELSNASGARVRAKRLAQAVELAGKLQALQAAGEAVISVGDYNAFSVNDGYVDVIGLLKGTEAPADQVTLWAASPVVPPLVDVIDLASADQRYSYVYDGNTQALDHILASAAVHPTGVAFGRMDADFPESARGDASTPARLSDHDPMVGYFSLPDIDHTAPVLTVPGPIALEGNAFGGAIVTYTASAFDAVDGAIVPACAPASGSLFTLGETTVTCTAADTHGNVTSRSFVVTVADTTAPIIAAVTPSRSSLWPPNHWLVPVTLVPTVADAVDAAPACAITGVSGTDGASDADWTITGPLTLALRAERSGNAKAGRVYTIAVACADASGNVSAPATATVTVPHDQRK